MKKNIFFSVLLLNFLQIHSQSYEGYIGDNIPVWFEINESTDDNTTGSYFYKKNGGSILLSGQSTSNKIKLNEKNKTGEVSGIFDCFRFSDSLIGNWKNTKTNKLLQVKLYKVDPSFKTYAKIPSAEKLFLSNGKVLNDDLKNNIDGAGKKPKLNFTLAEKSIISSNFSFDVEGGYGTTYYSFDLTNNYEITLTNEIDSNQINQFNELLIIKLQKKVDDYRKASTEEELIDLFGDKETLEASTKVTEVSDKQINNYYLKRGFAIIMVNRFFDFPRMRQGADLYAELEISFTELYPYLYSTSVLRNLK